MNIALWNKGRDQILTSDSALKDIFACFSDEHFPLVTGLDYDLNIYLYCLECNYRKTIGLDTYEKVVKYADILR